MKLSHNSRICDQLCRWMFSRELWEALCKENSAIIITPYHLLLYHHYMGGSINYHRKVLFMLDGLRFVILRSFWGSICLFVQSYSSLYSFTHKQIDHQKQPRKLTKLIYRNAHISFQHIDTRGFTFNFSVQLHHYLLHF